jgi:hypothetical protein
LFLVLFSTVLFSFLQLSVIASIRVARIVFLLRAMRVLMHTNHTRTTYTQLRTEAEAQALCFAVGGVRDALATMD